jgi:hypothetical protein
LINLLTRTSVDSVQIILAKHISIRQFRLIPERESIS